MHVMAASLARPQTPHPPGLHAGTRTLAAALVRDVVQRHVKLCLVSHHDTGTEHPTTTPSRLAEAECALVGAGRMGRRPCHHHLLHHGFQGATIQHDRTSALSSSQNFVTEASCTQHRMARGGYSATVSLATFSSVSAGPPSLAPASCVGGLPDPAPAPAPAPAPSEGPPAPPPARSLLASPPAPSSAAVPGSSPTL